MRIAQVQGQIPAATGTYSHTVSGFSSSSEMRAALSVGVRDDTLDTADNNASISFGGAVSTTTQRVISAALRHGQTVSLRTNYRFPTDDETALIMNGAGARDASADFSTFATDGVTWDLTDTGTLQYYHSSVLIAGADVQAFVGEFTSSATQDATTNVTWTDDFSPDIVIVWSNADAFTATASATGATFSLGGCWNDNSTLKNRCTAFGATSPGTAYASLASNTRASVQLSGSAQVSAVEVTSMTLAGGGFVVTTRDAAVAMTCGFLALKVSSEQRLFFDFVTSPVVGDPAVKTFSTPGFPGKFAMMFVTRCQTLGTLETDADAGVFGVSLMDWQSANHSSCYAVAMEDAASTSNTESMASNEPIRFNDHAGTALWVATKDAIGTIGPSYNFSTNADTVARQWLLFYVGIDGISASMVGSAVIAAALGGSSSLAAALLSSTVIAAPIDGSTSLSASMLGSALLAGVLGGSSSLAAAPIASAIISAALGGSTSLSSAVLASAVLSAALDGTSPLSSSQVASAILSAALAGSSSLAAAPIASAVIAAALAGSSSLASSQVASALVAAALAGSTALASSQTASAVLAGGLESTTSLAGALTASALISGTLGGSSSLSSTMVASVLVTGALSDLISGDISAALVVSAAVSGALAGSSTLSAAMLGTALVAAPLSGQSDVSATLLGQAIVSGAIGGSSSLAASLVASATVAGATNGSSSLASSLIATVTINAELHPALVAALLATANLTGTLQGTSALSAALLGQAIITGGLAEVAVLGPWATVHKLARQKINRDIGVAYSVPIVWDNEPESLAGYTLWISARVVGSRHQKLGDGADTNLYRKSGWVELALNGPLGKGTKDLHQLADRVRTALLDVEEEDLMFRQPRIVGQGRMRHRHVVRMQAPFDMLFQLAEAVA